MGSISLEYFRNCQNNHEKLILEAYKSSHQRQLTEVDARLQKQNHRLQITGYRSRLQITETATRGVL